MQTLKVLYESLAVGVEVALQVGPSSQDHILEGTHIWENASIINAF